VEELKAALRELARREPEFLIGLIADAASSRRDLALKLASVVAGVVAVPLDVATKQDIRRLERRTARLEREVQEIKNAMATKEDIKRRLEDQMATKEDLKQYATKQDLETAIGDLKKWAEAEFREIRNVMATKEDIKREVVPLEEALG